MSAIGGMLGLSGGVNGSGVQGPQRANIVNPVTGEQLATANTGVQNSLQSQQQLMQALQGQNGIGNQSQVYNQLQGVANGTGPNPAQAMLANATGANVANQAALMAGQRGAGANVGLMARQAGQQGANIQQQAAGQGAALQANQSLNALGAAGNMAGQQVQNQMGATAQNNAANQAYQQGLLNAQGQYNASEAGVQSSINSANAGMASTAMKGQQDMIGGLLGGAGSAMGMAEGGEVSQGGPQSTFGKFLAGMEPMGNVAQLSQGANDFGSGIGAALGRSFAPSVPMQAGYKMGNQIAMKDGGKVPAMVSPGEGWLPPEKAKEVVKDGKNPLSIAEKIPGKPKYPGNDYRNDVVPKNLKEGGVVIPNSVMQSSDPAGNAAKFVAATLAKSKHGMRK